MATNTSSFPLRHSRDNTLQNTVPFDEKNDGKLRNTSVQFKNCRGRIPSINASRLRTMYLEAKDDPTSIVAAVCTYDGLSSRLAEEAGFPYIFLAGYAMSSSLGLPDAGYIGFQDVASIIQETVRQVSLPIMVDGDTGYGSSMNTKRTVEGFALSGAAGVMIEDQVAPKRCGHTKGKQVVGRAEAFSRMQAAVDARNQGVDIVILARTDALIVSYEEAIFRAKKFVEIGADIIFIEALPNKEAMKGAIRDVPAPVMLNNLEGGLTEELSAKQLAEMGFAAVSYPLTCVAAKIKSLRKAFTNLKDSFKHAAPPPILTFAEVCEAVGFNRYWEEERKYAVDSY